MDHVELAYSNLTVGPRVAFNFTEWIHLDVYAAGAIYRRYELFRDDDRIARRALAPGLGYGARFWIAPRAGETRRPGSGNHANPSRILGIP